LQFLIFFKFQIHKKLNLVHFNPLHYPAICKEWIEACDMLVMLIYRAQFYFGDELIDDK